MGMETMCKVRISGFRVSGLGFRVFQAAGYSCLLQESATKKLKFSSRD